LQNKAHQDSFSRLKETMRWRVAVAFSVLLLILTFTLAVLNTHLGLSDTALLAWLVFAVAGICLLLLWRLPRATSTLIFFNAICLLLVLVPVYGWYYGRAMHYWCYVFPPLLVFLLPSRKALIGMAAYGVYVVAVLSALIPLIEIIRFASSYGLTVCFIYTYALLEERAAIMLHHHSNYDALSNCLNRRTFNTLLAEMINDEAGQGTGAVLLMDIDHFKHINDQYGHQSGDRVITDVAGLLKSNVRPQNPVFRYGGEEFAVLLQGQDEQGGWLLAERLREAVAVAEFGGITVTISVGVAQWRPGDSSDAVIARADRALYAAKNQGRNRSVRASAFTDG
jgi:diguanylate cyclase (GGDEF)-like protein